ncbi:energy-coupling factor transport system substrate-specific component [Seinonella peptonophila]|uniref:Energy-coupling factor transport system substrate-specific component n=1 Tax=Seinonella peptonophila TaxID=112248 RepID=A0A1M5BAJ8_9BACL|nr:ECF transporter S component [Seinonella peptonophila]SHF39202.1 energy-coupling factor transport system substrate-specific component [Seinonella peptonophila]
MEGNKYSIKADFTLMAMMLIPIAIAINILGGQIAAALKLPIYVDTIGTLLIAILAGPWVGALTGLLSNLINGIFDPVFIPYAMVSIAVGLVAGYLSRAKMFNSIGKMIISGIILGLTAAIISSPITAFMFGGVTGSGSTLITGVFLAAGQSLLKSVITTSIITDLADKIISIAFCFFIIKSISIRYLSKFSLGTHFTKKRA